MRLFQMSSFQFSISKLWAGRDFMTAKHFLPFSMHFTKTRLWGGWNFNVRNFMGGRWESQGYFKPDPTAEGEAFVIAMPPPNVTGALHMGHAMFVTLEVQISSWLKGCFTLQRSFLLWLLLTTKINHNYGFLKFTPIVQILVVLVDGGVSLPNCNLSLV